jgi:hypothetical protein
MTAVTSILQHRHRNRTIAARSATKTVRPRRSDLLKETVKRT